MVFDLSKRNEFMENLRKKGEYAEVIVSAWGAAEFFMDDVLLREYGLSSSDQRSAPLLKLDFETKLRLQKNIGLLSKEEFYLVKAFQEQRNNVFHKEGLFFSNTPKAKKEELAEIAIKAVQVMDALQARSFNPHLHGVRWTTIAMKSQPT